MRLENSEHVGKGRSWPEAAVPQARIAGVDYIPLNNPVKLRLTSSFSV